MTTCDKCGKDSQPNKYGITVGGRYTANPVLLEADLCPECRDLLIAAAREMWQRFVGLKPPTAALRQARKPPPS
jgi:hypothetical protein